MTGRSIWVVGKRVTWGQRDRYQVWFSPLLAESLNFFMYNGDSDFWFFCHDSFIRDSENVMDGETALYNISDMFFLGEESWRIVKELESTDISLYLYYTSEERGTTWS